MSRMKASMGPDNQLETSDSALHHRNDSSQTGGVLANRHDGSRRRFLWHLAEMVAAMMIGMFLGVGIFLSIVGGTYPEARHQYPTAALLVMAFGMTVPMVAWMRYRGHNRRDSIEMAAAMMLPVVPFLVLLWCHVTNVALSGPYMAVSTVAMLALMIHRRDVYSAHPMKPLRIRTR